LFPEVLNQVLTRLEHARKNGLFQAYVLISGFAVSAWGISRATEIIDIAVALGTSQPHALAVHLSATYEAGDADDPLQGVFHLTIKNNGQKVPVQLIILRPKWAEVLFKGIKMLNVIGCAKTQHRRSGTSSRSGRCVRDCPRSQDFARLSPSELMPSASESLACEG